MSDFGAIGKYRKLIVVWLFLFISLYHSINIFGIRNIDCPSIWLKSIGSCSWDIRLILEIFLWISAIYLLLFEIRYDHDFKLFLYECLKNWQVFVFVILAIISIAWSIVPLVTLHRIFLLFSATLGGIYIGIKYDLGKLVEILGWLYSLISILSLLVVFIYPDIGIMTNPISKGGWSGIFWHRNYLGTLLALAIPVYVICLLQSFNLSRNQTRFQLLGLVAVCLLVIKSKSANGIITLLVLIFFMLILFGWIKLRRRLKVQHYLGTAILLITGVIITLTNLDVVFGFFGRNTSLTGRIPLWSELFSRFIAQRPILGYGYGAIWHLNGIRFGLAQELNWEYSVLIGDNGFIDVLLHLGAVGLVIIIGSICGGIFLGLRYLLQKRTILSGFPVLFFIYVIVVNISLSMILESESFLWMVGVAIVINIRSNHLIQDDGNRLEATRSPVEISLFK